MHIYADIFVMLTTLPRFDDRQHTASTWLHDGGGAVPSRSITLTLTLCRILGNFVVHDAYRIAILIIMLALS